MGRKSKEQKELERQQMLDKNPQIKFELDEKVSLKRFLKYYGYNQMSVTGLDHLYESMKNHKLPEIGKLAEIMNEGGYSCHTLSLRALYTGLTDWNSKRKKYIDPGKLEVKITEVTSPVEEVKEVKPVIEKPVIINGGVSIVGEPVKEEVVEITTNVEPEAPVTEVKIEKPTVEAKPKKKRGRKSKAEKEAERLAAEQAQTQETSNDNQ